MKQSEEQTVSIHVPYLDLKVGCIPRAVYSTDVAAAPEYPTCLFYYSRYLCLASAAAGIILGGSKSGTYRYVTASLIPHPSCPCHLPPMQCPGVPWSPSTSGASSSSPTARTIGPSTGYGISSSSLGPSITSICSPSDRAIGTPTPGFIGDADSCTCWTPTGMLPSISWPLATTTRLR